MPHQIPGERGVEVAILEKPSKTPKAERDDLADGTILMLDGASSTGAEDLQDAAAARLENPHVTLISLANREATPRERRLVFASAVLLFSAFAATVPFASSPLSEFNAFVPSCSAVMFVNDVITAILLYSQCAIFPSRSFLILASGYLFTALTIVPHALTFPGAFAATGLIGANLQSAPWLFFSAHFVFPAALLGYAKLEDIDREKPMPQASILPALAVSVAVVLVLTCGVGLMSTIGSRYLPTIMIDRTHPVRPHLMIINLSIAGIALIAFVELWRRRGTLLNYWLMVICLALIQEELLFSVAVERFTLGFYMGRVFWLITSTVVLIVLLRETIRLYGRLVRSYALLARERENKLSSARAITASIAHEVRQPLTAIVASGGAAVEYLGKIPADLEKARRAIGKIIREAHRASDVVDGIHALFVRPDQKLEAIDLNEIIKNVLRSLSGELMDCGVTTIFDLGDVPAVEGDRNQLQQVVFNLVNNSLEAMQTATNRRRVLRVVTTRGDNGSVCLLVEDSGPGIDPAQLEAIFDPFVTTKSYGMGLGLAICREIIEHHRGQLFASNGTKGAVFKVVLRTKPLRNVGDHV
jgi:signal transduction histidine kinase